MAGSIIETKIKTEIDDGEITIEDCNLVELPSVKEEYVLVDNHKAFNDTKFQCDVCSTKFKESEYLQIHSLIHQSEKVPEYCQLCGTMLQLKGKRMRKKQYVCHINKHIKDKMAENKSHTKFYMCKLCDERYSTSFSLRRHQRTLHDTGISLVCKMCSKKFYNKKDLQDHRQIEHSYKVRMIKCICCNKEFSSYQYKRHVNTHADLKAIVEKKRIERMTKRNTFKCQLCGEVLFSEKLRVSHMVQHLQYTQEDYEEANKKGKFYCKVCSRLFSRKQALLSHTACHMAKTHKCEECGKSFSYYSLFCHRRWIHMSFECKICKATVKGAEKMVIHTKRYHSKIHQCHCGKIFYSKFGLKKHSMIPHNEGAKPKYGKQFPTELSPSVPKDHHNRDSCTNFTCNICNKGFKYEHHLKQHIEYLHKNNKK